MNSLVKQKADSWIAPTVVFLFALALFSLNLDRPPHPDELHHILAAQHLFVTGQPLIGEGEYWRGILHTWLVALSYEVFGEGLSSARLPNVLLVALVAPILFHWVRREAGTSAAWLTAILFISSPFTVEIAQFSRFYALQMFFFVLGVLGYFYTIFGSFPVWRRVSLSALAAVLLALSIWMQVTSLVGMVAIAVWTLGLVVHRAFLSPATSQTGKRILIALLVVTGILVILVANLTDAFETGWERYRETQLFNLDNQDEFWFYHIRFLVLYSTLWSLVGLIAVFAAVQSPRLAWLAITIFGISFLLMSFAGPKATRYLSFAPPFLAIVWGIGLTHVAPPLKRYLRGTQTRLTESFAPPGRFRAISGITVVAIVLTIVVLANPFWLRTATMIGGVALPLETPTTDWRAARKALVPWTSNADIMIATEELGAIYFLGRADVSYNPSKLLEIPPDQRFEFGIDHRTGRPTISKPESLERLIECFPSGFVVGPINNWGDPIRFSTVVQEVLTKHARPIEVPEVSHLFAWGWRREPEESKPEFCSGLTRFSGVQKMR